MKQILNQLCRASITAAGVMVATSAASAESKPVQFETEFDLNLNLTPGGLNLQAPQATRPVTFDVAKAAADWQESIGAYLDTLLEAEPAPAVPSTSRETTPDSTTDAAVKADLAAFAAAEPAATSAAKPLPPEVLEALGLDPADAVLAVPAGAKSQPDVIVNPLLLAPTLSHPTGCDACHHGHADPGQPEPITSAAGAGVDDAAAWQTLADWASARAAESTQPAGADDAAAFTLDSDFFFEVDADENSPTE